MPATTRNQSTTLSIAIPLYNKFTSIEATVLSCINTCTNSGIGYEIVVTNNASKDASPVEIDKCLAKFPGVRIFHLPQTISGQDNWLFALNCCQGKYFKLQLADDQMPAFDLLGFLAPLESDLADYVVGKTEAIFRSQDFATPYFEHVNSFRALIHADLTDSEKMTLLINSGNIINSHNMFGDANALIFHRKCLETLNQDVSGFMPAFTIAPDIDLYLSLFAHHRGTCIDQVVANFCYYNNSPCVKRANEVDYDHEGLRMLEILMPLYFISSSKFERLTRHLSKEQKNHFVAKINQISRKTLKLEERKPPQSASQMTSQFVSRNNSRFQTGKALALSYLKKWITKQ